MQEFGVDRLGPFPLLQFAAALIVVIGLALAILRGTLDRKKSEQQFPLETRWFFDGPLNAALAILRDIRISLQRIEENTKPIAEELRNQTRELAEISNTLDDLKAIKNGRRGRG